MRAASYLAKLRGSGVLVRAEGVRLIVEAPPGRITPEVRANLARLKTDILSELAEELSGDHILLQAIHDVAGLLAVAYERYTRAGRVRQIHAGIHPTANLL